MEVVRSGKNVRRTGLIPVLIVNLMMETQERKVMNVIDVQRTLALMSQKIGGYIMTAKEREKCVEAMEYGIRKSLESKVNFKMIEEYEKIGNKTDRDIQEKLAFRNLGEAEGVNQVLALIGFEHPRMKELAKLI